MADNVNILNAVGVTVQVRSTDLAGVHTFHRNVDTVSGATVAFGSGVMAATVQRVTVATDDALVANSSAMATSLALLDNAISGAGINVTQFAGASVPVGAGTEAAAIRVTLPTDGTGKVTVAAGAADATVGSTATAGAVMMGLKSVNMDNTAPPTRVSIEGAATNVAADWDGAIFTHPHGPQVWGYHSDGSSALTDSTVQGAPSAGFSVYVTDITVSTGAATAMNVFFEEGATKVLGPWYLEATAGRGLVLHFTTPKKITAATALTVTTSANIAQSIDVTGFIAQG